MDKHFQWIIPAVIALAFVIGVAYMGYRRLEVLSYEYRDNIKFQQRTEDRLDILERFCCDRLKDLCKGE